MDTSQFHGIYSPEDLATAQLALDKLVKSLGLSQDNEREELSISIMDALALGMRDEEAIIRKISSKTISGRAETI